MSSSRSSAPRSFRPALGLGQRLLMLAARARLAWGELRCALVRRHVFPRDVNALQFDVDYGRGFGVSLERAVCARCGRPAFSLEETARRLGTQAYRLRARIRQNYKAIQAAKPPRG